jgi:hypothetical protein
VGEYAIARQPHCGPTGCVERGDKAECVVPLDPACPAGRTSQCTLSQERIDCVDGRIVARTQCAVCTNGQCIGDAGGPDAEADANDANDAEADANDANDASDANDDARPLAMRPIEMRGSRDAIARNH